MAICYPCDLTAKEGTFDITGTIVESVGAEYVNHHADNDPADGDACELIIGILVDAAPPFDGATLPPTDTYLKIGCIDMEVAANSAICGKCLPISFCDGADGRGKVPVRNLISVDNQSRSPLLVSCDVCVGGDKPFHRGDCNYSNVGSFSVDIADAAAAVSYLFYSGDKKYEAPCLDACDSNDDGRVDLADVLHILKFLFQFGAFPPAPGPGFDDVGGDVAPGSDPTPDELTCGVGSSCP
jgi:hypothetical protein